MPANPSLTELRIEIVFSGDRHFTVITKLIHHAEYPPAPRIENGKLVFDTGVIVGRDVRSHVLEEVFRSAPEGMENFIGQILPAAALDFLPFMQTPPLSSSTYSGPGRIAIVYDEPMLDSIPWELISLDGANELRAWCPIVRRSLRPARERTGSVDLPLNVSIESATRKLDKYQLWGWARDLFDDFTRYARDLESINWGTPDQLSTIGEIRHVVFESNDEESLSELGRKIQSMIDEVLPPRLLVLHDLSGSPEFFPKRLVSHGLAVGADAVLLVTTHSHHADAGGFFPTFYRKLMHNQPLDQALWLANNEAVSTSSKVDYVLGAREGAEFGLLLTGIVLEAALVEPVVRKGPDRGPFRGKDAAGGPVYDRVRRRRRQVEKKRRTPGPTKISDRAAQLRDELQSQTTRKVEDLKAGMLDIVGKTLSETSFDEELHGVSVLVDVRRSIEKTRRATATAAVLLDDLQAPPGDVERGLVRLTNIWITDDSATASRTISEFDHLIKLKPYQLHLQIGPPREDITVSVRFHEETLKEVFEKVDEVELDVAFFSTDEDFEIEGAKAESNDPNAHVGVTVKMVLPKFGSSEEVQVKIIPLKSGPRRIRTCIYHRNVMLQSVLLEAEVVNDASEVPEKVSPEKVITGRSTDYVATVDFALLNELPEPSLNVFVNDDGAGTHWVGAFSRGDTTAFQLKSGSMRTFEHSILTNNAENIRTVLMNIEGENSYKFGAPLPVDDKDLTRREGYFRDLAIRGWRLFHPLFVVEGTDNGDNAQRLQEFRKTTKDSHIISIARCGKDSATIPWAALYSNPIDAGKADQIKLCEVFKKQLAANEWSDTELTKKHDLLDDPKACRSQQECPLNTDKRKLTVCPFGFWGYIHQVEQPLQQVTSTPVDQVPEELVNYDFGQTSFITCSINSQVKVAMCAYPGIPDVVTHSDEIRGLKKDPTLSFEYKDERDQILSMLETGGQHFYYFYCHGDVDQKEKLFRLKVGPLQKPGFIESSNLLPDEISWETPKPLFIMNGCETMAVTPDLTHGFLHTLKALGAAGIVGTEVKVWTQLARPFGLRLLTYMLDGMSVGEAFLEVRKYLLRQLNPLGLIYSYYAPATLHLHDPAGCKWCEIHAST